MDQLDVPTPELWEKRQRWFRFESERHINEFANYLVSEHACALTFETEIAFCAGAWVTVIVFSAIVVEAHLRDVAIGNSKVNAENLINQFGENTEELHWLRKRRNELVHSNLEKPTITVDDQWGNREKLENDAKRAVGIMFAVFYSEVGL